MAWGRENATSGLTSILNGFRAGQDRARNWDKEVADRKQKAAEFNAQHDPYEEATTDDRGLPNGMKQRDDYYDRDAAVNEPLSPHFFHGQEQMPDKPVPPPPAPPAAPAPGPGAQGADGPTAENDPQILASRAANRAMGIDPTKMDANRHPDSGVGKPELAPGDPKPLLRDPKAVLAEQQHGHTQDQAEAQRQAEAVTLEGGQKAMLERGADWAEVDPNAPKHYMGRDPKTGKDQYQVNASRVGVNIPEGASIKGDGGEEAAAAGLPSQAPAGAAPAPPGNAPAPASLRPSPYMMKRITDLNTMMPRAGQRMVDVNELSPDMQERLGVTDEMRQNHTKLPSDLVTKYMIGDQRLDAAAMKTQATGANKDISAEAQQFIKRVEQGGSVADAIADYRGLTGKSPSPTEYKAFSDAHNRTLGDKRFDLQGDRFGLSKEKFGQAKSDFSSKVLGTSSAAALKLVSNDLENLAQAEEVKKMVARRDTAGLEGKIQIMLTRPLVGGRISNYDLGLMSGMTGAENVAEQLLGKFAGEGLTDQNKALFYSIAGSLSDKYAHAVEMKTSAVKRGAIAQLIQHGVPEDQAQEMVENTIDAHKLLDFKGSREQQASKKEAYPGVVPRGGKPDASTFDGRAKLMNFKNMAIAKIMADEKRTASQKRIDADKVQKMFEADMAKTKIGPQEGKK